MDVLYEDNHLLAVNKPAGLPTMGVSADRRSLLVVAKQYLKEKYDKPGNVYLGIVSRLDAPVTGVVLMCKTSKAASRLTTQFQQRSVEKIYGAVVAGHIRPLQGRLEHFLRKDERHRRMHTTHATAPGALEARLSYQVVEEGDELSLVRVVLETGRKHQIRVQWAAMKFPVVGDRKYGSRVAFPQGIALHASQLRVIHPVRQTGLTIRAPFPRAWRMLPFDLRVWEDNSS